MTAPTLDAVSASTDRPEAGVALAAAGGILLALILKRLGHRD